VTAEFATPASEELLRRRPLRRLVEPWLERRFTYGRYDRFLAGLQERDAWVGPLAELRTVPREHLAVGLRHDVDDRLASALQLARLEARRGLRATYFLLHTAPYYRRERSVMKAFRELQDGLGHEVGIHYDVLSLQLAEGADARAVLRDELAWLRSGGLRIGGAASHGSYWSHKLGFANADFFAAEPRFVDGVELARGTLAEYGLDYEAYALGNEHARSDAHFDASGRRWHPELLAHESFRPGERIVVLTHPCLWDASVAAKAVRTTARLVRSVVRRRRV
jgi:hypothetical protein